MELDLNMFCEQCKNTCCDNIAWRIYINGIGNGVPLTGIYLNHPDLNGIRLVRRPNGRYRCMELDQKTNKCTRYDTRPYICKDFQCNILHLLGFNFSENENPSDKYLLKIMKMQNKSQWDYREYIINQIGVE